MANLNGEFDFVCVSYTSVCLTCSDYENILKVFKLVIVAICNLVISYTLQLHVGTNKLATKHKELMHYLLHKIRAKLGTFPMYIGKKEM